MMWKNTDERYGLVAMLLHWVGAALVFCLLAIGIYMVDLPDGDDKWGLYDLHKSLAVLFVMLLAVRLLWKKINAAPRLPNTLASHEKRLAQLTHVLIYLMMICMPISGYIDSSAGGYHLSFFSFFDVPMLVEENDTLARISVLVHRYVAYALIVVILLHVGAAIKHHFISKDNVLLRMLPLRLRS